MSGRPPAVDHLLDRFIAASRSARDLVQKVSTLSSVNPNTPQPRLHPEQARRVVELAFLGLVSSWDEFLEQTFVRYLAGAKTSSKYAPRLRIGNTNGIHHAYHVITGKPDFDPSRSYSKFHDPRWVIDTAKIYFELGAPYATALHPSLAVLNHAIKLRNRVAHNSSKARADFKMSAREHLGLGTDAPLAQGYSVGDLLVAPASHIFGKQAGAKGWTYFRAYNARLRKLARNIVPT